MPRIRANYPEIFARCSDPRLLHSCARPARHPRSDPRGARGLLGNALRRARLRHLAGQLPRYPGRPPGERADLRLRCAKDPRARQGPCRGREADPEEPRLRHPPRAAGDSVLRGLQPAQRQIGRRQRNTDRAHHANQHQDQRRRIRVRHHHLRHRVRRDHRQFRPHRHQGRRWVPAEGQVEAGAADPSRYPGAGIPQHANGDGPRMPGLAIFRARPNTVSIG